MKDTDFLYASAVLRAREAGAVGPDKQNRLIEADSVADAFAMLEEYGLTVVRDEAGAPLAEPTLSAYLVAAFAEVADLPGADGALAFLRYPYDVNNLKLAIRCAGREDTPRAWFSPCGTHTGEDALRAVRKRDFSAYAPEIADGARTALDDYAVSGNGQAIDLPLDRACFAAMRRAAGEDGFLASFLALRADLLNCLTFARLCRRDNAAEGRRLLPLAWLPGGTLSAARMADALTGGADSIGDGPAGAFAGLDLRTSPFSELERAADNACLSALSRAAFIPFGAAVPAAYILSREYEVKNLRIILSAKRAGLPPADIRARVRRAAG